MNAKNEICIREFLDHDAPDISRLIIDNLTLVNSREYGEEAANQLARFYTPQHLLKYAQNGNLFVALKQSQLIGTASLDQDRVRNVFVRIDHHHQGIGRLLMQHIEDVARQQGKQRLALRASLVAVPFYQKLGYTILKEIHEPIGDAQIKVIEMEKQITP